MERTRQEYLDLIDETVNYYSEDPSRRSQDPITWRCFYLSENGNKCAVGRCIDPKKYDPKWDRLDSISVSELECQIESSGEVFEDIFLDKYKGFFIKFWADLQMLHDEISFWDSKGLTREGQDYVDSLKLQWGRR